MSDLTKLHPVAWPETWTLAELHLFDRAPFNAIVGSPSLESRRAMESRGMRVVEPSEAAAVIAPRSVWPRVRSFEDSGGLAAGPTGRPWVDSNGWRIQVARAKTASRPVWLAHQPPRNRVLRAAEYQLALAEAMTWGARWIVHFDDKLERDLRAGKADALRTWKAMADTVNWLSANQADAAFAPAARLAVVSRFEDSFLNEVLNLLARRQVAFLPVLPQKVGDLPFASLRAVVCTEPDCPQRVQQFAASGGLLITGRQSRNPYDEAARIHLALSRRVDLLRLFNGDEMATFYREAGNQRTSVDLVNYTAEIPGDDVTLQVASPFARARFITLGGGYVDARVRSGLAGPEVALPKFPVYARVEFWERMKP
jgi:hypothetical protein